jgi:hypothetical protein
MLGFVWCAHDGINNDTAHTFGLNSGRKMRVCGIDDECAANWCIQFCNTYNRRLVAEFCHESIGRTFQCGTRNDWGDCNYRLAALLKGSVDPMQ